MQHSFRITHWQNIMQLESKERTRKIYTTLSFQTTSATFRESKILLLETERNMKAWRIALGSYLDKERRGVMNHDEGLYNLSHVYDPFFLKF